MNNVIEARDLVKIYGKRKNVFTALGGINLSVSAGESVAIVGKSGSGKSTLMHLLALLDSPTSGKVFVNGDDVTRLKVSKINKLRNKTFGFVFQQFFLNASDSCLENVLLPLKIAGVNPFKRKKLALKALALVELSDKAKQKAKNLSGGQKQRVCIARALVNNPDIIFADEPTGNLDTKTGDEIEQILFGLVKKGKTLIVVTHDSDLASKCDRIINIRDGKIVEGSVI